MLKTIEAIIEKDGHVRLLEEVRLSGSKRALVTILDEEGEISEPALLSEAEPTGPTGRHPQPGAEAEGRRPGLKNAPPPYPAT